MTKVIVPRQAYTLFCDDIRQDASGGFTAIGIRPAELAIETEEVALPKFVFMTVLDLPCTANQRAMHMALLDGTKTLVETNFVVPGQSSSELDAQQRLVLTMPIEAAPFTAKVGMKLSVRVTGPDVRYQSHFVSVVLTSDFDRPEPIEGYVKEGNA